MNPANKRAIMYLILGLIVIGLVYYFSPLEWGLRGPRNYEECVKAGDQAPPSNPHIMQPFVLSKSQCMWGGKVFLPKYN